MENTTPQNEHGKHNSSKRNQKMNTGEINRKLDINSDVKYPSKCYQIQKSVS